MTTPGLRLFATLTILAALPLAAQPVRRITGPIENGRRSVLAGRVPRHATPQNDTGRVDDAFEVADMRLHLRASGETDLSQLLQEQQDPASPNFHKWLTPEQYGDRFGAAEADVKQIVEWLGSQGFTDIEAARSRTWIKFSGTAAQVRKAFGTELHRYRVAGETHFANATDPSIPAAIAAVVSGVRGLNDFRMQPRLRKVVPQLNNSGGRHNLAPDDIAAIYNIAPLYKDGVDGTGQKIVVVGQTAIRTSDIATFRSRFNLPTIDLKVQPACARNCPGQLPGDIDEAHLDIEWSGAVARNATIFYVYSNDVWDSAMYAVDNNIGQVISMSYGLCEGADFVNLPDFRQTAQQAAAQGISWFAASGDSGAGDCEDRGAAVAQNGFAVDSPASIPEITGVGGTQFDEQGGNYWSPTEDPTTHASALGYIPERVWNDGTSASSIGGGGGGASLVFPRPSWQTGRGVPAGGARLVPDVSLSSSAQHVGYYVYSGGVAYFGGTSAAAPVMAGIATLLNDYLVKTNAVSEAGLGNMNPAFYRLAEQTTNVFHDIVNGDNGVSCANGTPDCKDGYFGHYAGPGYDQATGLGSVDVYNLIHQWTTFPAISSAVVPSVDSNPVFQTAGAWNFKLTLTEEAGIGTKLSEVTVDGASRPDILALFQTLSIAPRGAIWANVSLTGIAAPKTVVLGFSGVDAGGAPWSTQYSVSFRGPQVRIRIAGISNAASGDQVYAPGMILSVYGEGFGDSTQAAAALPLPEFLAGFTAWINGVPAPVYYVSPNQVNLQIPYETQPGSASLVLGNPFENSNPYRFAVSVAGPGIFTFQDGRVNPSRNAARGQIVPMFITGEGQVTPSLATGATPRSTTLPANLPKPRASYSVTVGGLPARIDFIGIPTGLVGVTQVNIEIPAGLAAGQEYPVIVTIGGQPSNTAKILVQ